MGYSEACIAIGPWGGPEGQGKPWAYRAEGPITEIVIRHGGACIYFIVFQTKTSDGVTSFSERFGGSGGSKTDKVLISSGEYITGLEMIVGVYGGQTVITQLSIWTNVATYGPFGSTYSGTTMLIPVSDGIVVGFHGRAENYLNAIGIYAVAEVKSSNSVQELREVKNVLKIVGPREAGQWGPPGGRAWNDGVYYAVDQVFLKLGDYKGDGEELQVIQAIQFCYKKKDGKFINSSIYGIIDELQVQGSSDRLDKHNGIIKIDCSSDELVGIERFCGPLDRIISLSFSTRKRMYGPYGAEIGTSFTSSPSAGRVVGFFGRSGRYLTAIGLHTDYN